MGYIVDIYSPYANNENVKFIFNLNERQWCIREVEVRENLPLVALPIDDTMDLSIFFIYKSLEAAKCYVRQLKQLER